MGWFTPVTFILERCPPLCISATLSIKKKSASNFKRRAALGATKLCFMDAYINDDEKALREDV